MYAQLLLQFQADPFETLHMLLGWSEDMHIIFFQNPEIIFYHFYCIFNLDFFVFFYHLLDTLQWRGMVHGLQFYVVFRLASVLFVYFVKGYVVGTLLNCIDLSMQFN